MMKPRIEIRPLTDALPDEANLNKHTQKGSKLLENSMRKRGFNRPIAAAGKGVDNPVITAGNLTQETAVNIGMDKEAIFVYTDGSRPIVHVRTDIAPGTAEAVALGLEDNRIAQDSLDWDTDLLAQMAVGDTALLAALRKQDSIFNDLLDGITPKDEIPEFKEYGDDIADGIEVCKCPTCGHEHAAKKN